MTNAAIFFHPEGYETSRTDLKGRHVAGESFLNGFFRHSGLSSFTCCTHHPEHAQVFAEMANKAAPGRSIVNIPIDVPEKLAGAGCLFLPGPALDGFAWRRRAGDQRAYSLCGITHTTAESPEMFGALVTGPVQPWDALICTSQAARASVQSLILPYADYLRERLGATAAPLPHMPVIPLGVDGGAFRFPVGVREEERARYGIAPGDIAVLFVGRLVFHAKAHPYPMYAALERAARVTGRRIHLIQAGWFPNDHVQAAFVEGARRYCPSVNALFLDGRAPGVRGRIWAVGDIFASLADNVQETFGITPIEAMAAGIPCVVSDWNGYRDTVRDGVDGFRVPTLAPPPGCAPDLAARYALNQDTYDYYIGRTAQLAAVDIEAAAQAFIRLIEEPELARRMGEAGRQRVEEVFDWAAVIPRYLDLWRGLAEIRTQAVESAPWQRAGDANPLRPDPLAMFRSYPSALLHGDMMLERTPDASAAALAVFASDPMNSTAQGVVSPIQDLSVALDALTPPGRRAGDVAALVPPERRLLLFRSLVYLMKFGLVRPVQALTPAIPAL